MLKTFIDYIFSIIAKQRAFGALLVAGIAFLMVILGLWFDSSAIEEFENRTWDWRLRLVAEPGQADKNIKLIIIDQSTLDFFEREYGITWPFPRSIYQYVIDYLRNAGAKGIAFDMLFTEGSAQYPETDQILADASAGPFPVIHALTTEYSDKLLDRDEFNKLSARLLEIDKQRNFSQNYLSYLGSQTFKSATIPMGMLIEKSFGFGSVSASPDSDGIFRHYGVGGRLEGTPILSLPFAFYDMVEKPNEKFPIEQFLDHKGRLAINLHGPSGSYESYALKSVAQSQRMLEEGKTPKDDPQMIDPAKFKDAWVILGVWAPGLLDLRPTPLEEAGKGMEYVAAVLDNILHKNFVTKFSFLQSLAFAFVGISFSALIIFYLHNPLYQISAVISLLAIFVTFLLTLASQAIWAPAFLPFVGMFFTLISGLGIQSQVEGRQYRFVRGAFQYYVSKGVIDQIMTDPAKLSLGGEKRELSIYFSDIKGFTTISEKLEPTQLVQLLNEYLTVCTEIILNSGGTVDKYVGDAIVAFWNAPIDVPDHATRAVQAAIDCQHALTRLRPDYLARYGVDVYTRIGVHTGLCTVGNFGSQTRFNYTMIGDSANLASRLEGVNKSFGTTILFSEDTQKQLAGKIECREVASLKVVGKSEAVTVFHPKLDDDWLFTEEHTKLYQEALLLFNQGKLDLAKEKFQSLKDDPVALAYLKRIKEEQASEKTGNWSPIWSMTEK
jgi:adenylate cyclase